MGNMCVSQNSVKEKPCHPPAKETSEAKIMNHSGANSQSHPHASTSDKENSGPSKIERGKEAQHNDLPATPTKKQSHSRDQGHAEMLRKNSLDRSIQRVADEFIDDLINNQILIQFGQEKRD